ncbi:hypothetical protein [Terriglobus roseus]|uniref:Uncharacterized protein n=1 Tax=Terriglobus roseus TaxID=392734 RepID=A0A1G7H7L2_9BACT|nr:hypothetical protein [Terriglobus roseus]SDE96408.1 hypothetical protein SAMN05444167_0947 [Terriglobus roseus]
MKSKVLAVAVRVLSVLLLASTAHLRAQDHQPLHLSGLINDYTPLSATVKGSPWEMHGQWSMDIYPERGTADFSADMTMSGYGTISTGAVDPTQPLVNPHTHHIRLQNVRISSDISNCPVYLPPATKMGFQLNDVVKLLTGNGSIAPFETDPPSSTLQVCISGGDDVRYSLPNSNITLVFGGPATTHFGSQAIHGVVRPASEEDGKGHR